MNRVVFCWPHPGLTGWRLRDHAFRRMARRCADLRLYPGPGKIVELASPRGLRDAAHALAVPPHLLAYAATAAYTEYPSKPPLIAVAAYARDLNSPLSTPQVFLDGHLYVVHYLDDTPPALAERA